jgi:hypothetical protein
MRQQIHYNITTRNGFFDVVQPLYISSQSASMASIAYFIKEFGASIRLLSDRSLENQRPQICAKLAVLTQDEDIILSRSKNFEWNAE